MVKGASEVRISKDHVEMDSSLGHGQVSFSNGHFYVTQKIRVDAKNLPPELRNLNDTTLKSLLIGKAILVTGKGKDFVFSLIDRAPTFTWKKKVVASLAGGIVLGLSGAIIPGLVVAVGGSLFTLANEACNPIKEPLTRLPTPNITTMNSLPNAEKPKMDKPDSFVT